MSLPLSAEEQASLMAEYAAKAEKIRAIKELALIYNNTVEKLNQGTKTVYEMLDHYYPDKGYFTSKDVIKFLDAMSMHRTGLRRLDLKGIAINPDDLCEIFCGLIGITSLYLDSNNISDENTEDFKFLAHLETLDITECSRISVHGMCDLLKGLPNLRNFAISLGSQNLENLSQSVTKLEILSISNSGNENVNLQQLATGLGTLQSLRLSRFYKLRNETMIQLIPQMHALKNLDIAYCSLITDECFQTLQKYLKNLETLNLSFCSALSDKTFIYLAPCFKNLFHLNISESKNFTDEIFAIMGPYLGQLRSLNLKGSRQLTDHSLHLIKNFAPLLQSLNASCCMKMNKQTLTTLFGGIGSLHLK